MLPIVFGLLVATRGAPAACVRLRERNAHEPSSEGDLFPDVVGLVRGVLVMAGAAGAPFLAVHVQVVQVQIAVAEGGVRAALF